jgi:cytochrome b6-f complex iron-sulfur subunit
MGDGAAVTGRGLRRYLDDLLRGRRPRPFHATPAEADELRVALELRAARPAADAPREEFVAELHRRLAAELDTPAPPEPVPLRPHPLDRRRLLVSGAGLAAASAAVGAAADHLLTREAQPAAPDLAPTAGVWQTVAAGADLPEGAVRGFDLGTVAGFVHRAGGAVHAVSGSCTHQGCRLRLDAAGDLDCPCHTTVFAPSGEVITHQLPVAPGPLPRFATREVDGAVQVFAPPRTV